MATVTFDVTAFKAAYPEFSTVTESVLDGYFAQATIQLDPTDSSRVTDQAQRTILLYLLVAHLAMLFSGANGVSPTSLVGRVTQATQGSVFVGVGDVFKNSNALWYAQTKYGAMYWQLTSPFRRAVYVPGRSVPIQRTWRWHWSKP